MTGRVRPVTGGYSLGPINRPNAGSYAGLVTDDNNKLYMLSNNHIIADSNRLPVGTKILQPPPRDDVAILSKFVKINTFFEKIDYNNFFH